MRELSIMLAIVGGVVHTLSIGFFAILVAAYGGFVEAIPFFLCLLLVDVSLTLQYTRKKLAYIVILVVVSFSVYMQVKYDLFDSINFYDDISIRIILGLLLPLISSILCLTYKENVVEA